MLCCVLHSVVACVCTLIDDVTCVSCVALCYDMLLCCNGCVANVLRVVLRVS